MADRKIVQDQKFIYGWDDVANLPRFSTDHGATWTTINSGGGGGVDVQMNDVDIVLSASPIDFVSDIAGGKEFAEVIADGGGGVEVEVDKQIDYLSLAGGVGPVPTGFTFDRTIYRACEVIYALAKVTGELETGHIMILHDGSVAGVVVTRRGTEILPFVQGNPAIQFSADVSGNDCRLLYTETNGDGFDLSVKPRPIRIVQEIEIEFVAITSGVISDVPSTHQVQLRINTSDGLPASRNVGCTVDDDGTGSAIPGADYSYLVQNPNWSIGDPDGTIVSVNIDILGTNVDRTIDLSFSGLAGGAVAGPNTNHQVTLFSAGA